MYPKRAFICLLTLFSALSCGAEKTTGEPAYLDRDATTGLLQLRTGFYAGTVGLYSTISPTCLTDTSRFCCPSSLFTSVDISGRSTDINGKNVHFNANGTSVAEVANGLDWNTQGDVVYDQCTGTAEYNHNFVNVLHGAARYIYGYTLTLSCPASPTPTTVVLSCVYSGTLLFADN